jgi:hypothetical protein
VGAQLRQSTPEESGLNADRLAELLTVHPSDRLELFWSDVVRKPATINPNTITGQLQSAILASDMTRDAIAQASGVDAGVISRFMTGERTLRLDTVDKLTTALGLRLCHGKEGAE